MTCNITFTTLNSTSSYPFTNWTHKTVTPINCEITFSLHTKEQYNKKIKVKVLRRPHRSRSN